MKEQQQRQIFDSLYAQYHAMVLQLCMGFMKGDQALAQDLLQEIFINTWNALSGYRGDASYKTWIYRITVNTCLQYIRKEKARPGISVTDMDKQVKEEATVFKDDYGQLYQAIGQLGEVDRLIIMMVLDEMEYDEICKIVGISEVNLRVKIHRIKQRLKKIMSYEY